jgi:uncharacterized protein
VSAATIRATVVSTNHFEWDLTKAAANLANHGVSFEAASGVFYDPLAISLPDDQHSEGEERSVIIGLSLSGRLLVVAYTQRGERWRIISARRPTPRERDVYQDDG